MSLAEPMESSVWESPEWQEAVRQNTGLKPFFDNLESFVELPEGVEKLRDLVLELAVRGKTVAQNHDDEPANSALERIKSEQTALVESKDIRKPKKTLPIDEVPFAVPNGWAWTRLGDVCFVITDGVHKTPTYVSEGVPFLSIKDISSGKLDFSSTRYVTREAHEKMIERCHPKRGDLLFTRIGTLGTNVVVDCDVEFSIFVSVGLIKYPQHEIDSRFLSYLMNSPPLHRQYQEVKAGGSHTDKLNLGDMPQLLIPFPPLAEQRRIVSKVEGMMSLCDTLESHRLARESVRERASRSVLASLTSAPRTACTPQRPKAAEPNGERQGASRRFSDGDVSPDSPTASALSLTEAAPKAQRRASGVETLASAWQRLSDHFEVLLDRPETLAHLRQSILQLAVQGKLVPQDPNDEPASSLLAKDYELPAEYKRKRKIVKKTPVNTPEDLLIELPQSWEYVVIQDLYDKNIIVDYADGNHGALYPRKHEFGKTGETFVSAKDLAGGRVVWDSCSKLNKEKASQLTKGWAEGGDVLLTHNATVGRVALVEPEASRFLLGTSVTFYRLNADAIIPEFLYLVFQAPVWQGQMGAIMAQTTRNQVSIQKQAFFQVPLPPLAEQKRIVSKVSVLLSQLDELSARLRSRQSTTDVLLTALIHQILEGSK
ncbi:restriction endonuclease subunit S [Crateriforma conspicua]|uniref:restriction endonuclease subunit S n=1 Tax=Crateriforma conspicua TaxID=2527996 RepID=UPI0011884666|nr:restriction endonuclease subunit S [Crateriforma conspicua]QDV63390.1 EcoKI restriction-modification system protein HsdS [Crateriforma conspicua]